MAMATTEYLESKVLTATPYQLHLMIVEGALREAAAAQEALQLDKVRSHAHFDRARQFVAELISGLDEAKAPEMVAHLQSLFLFIHRTLVRAELDHDPQLVSDALRLLRIHRETWIALGDRLAAMAPASSGDHDTAYCWRQ